MIKINTTHCDCTGVGVTGTLRDRQEGVWNIIPTISLAIWISWTKMPIPGRTERLHHSNSDGIQFKHEAHGICNCCIEPLLI